MVTASKRMEDSTKNKKERKGVRGKPTVSLYSRLYKNKSASSLKTVNG